MPTYEYVCEKCGARLEERRAIVDRETAAACPCGGDARFVISAPAGWIEKDRWKRVRKDIRGGR